MPYCAYCKTSILDIRQKCPNCGSTRYLNEEAPPTAEPKVEVHTVYVEKPVYVERPVYTERTIIRQGESAHSWLTALLLCLFLGGIGAHRFYVGKGFTGFLYLITFGVFGVGWLIDLILILTGSFHDKQGFPLRRN